jgi:cytochrome P450 family 4
VSIEIFLGLNKFLLDVLTNMCNYTKNYGPILKAQIGPFRKFLLVSDYKFLESILSSTKLVKKSDDYNFFHPWLGNGLLTSDGNFKIII